MACCILGVRSQSTEFLTAGLTKWRKMNQIQSLGINGILMRLRGQWQNSVVTYTVRVQASLSSTIYPFAPYHFTQGDRAAALPDASPHAADPPLPHLSPLPLQL